YRGLQEIAVSGGALGVELEIFNAAVVQDNKFNVLPSDVHNDVGIVVELQRRLCVRDGLDQGDVGLENIFQNILCVTGCANPQDLELGSLGLDLPAQVFEHLDRVLDRVAVRELVSLAKDVAVFVQQHGLSRSGTTIDANEATHGRVSLKACWRKLLSLVLLPEEIEFFGIADQALAARLGLFFLASIFDVMHELVVAAIATYTIVFALAEFNGAERGEILGVLRDLDQIFGLRARGYFHFALAPHARNIRLP